MVATDSTVRIRGEAPPASPAARVGWLLPPFVLMLYAVKPLGPIKDPDAYWHVVAGDHLLKTGQFVLADPFGAATERMWILNQWLPEVLMHWAHAAYGLPGIAFLLCAGSLLVGLSVYASCRCRADSLPTALVLVLVFVALSGSLSPRPQLATFALTALTVGAWLRTREDGRARWWLVPVTWLWACSHGMWFMGPVLGGVALVGMVFDRRVSLGSAVRLSLVPVLSVAAAAVTPVGPRLFLSPFQVGSVTAYISEWQRPSLGEPAVLAALGLFIIVGVNLARRRSAEWTTVLLAVVGLGLTLTWARTVGLGAVVVAPMAAAALQKWTRRPMSPPFTRERVGVAVVGILSLVTVGVAAPAVAASPAIGPTALEGALSALPQGTVVCNDQSDGGWLMLRHPNLRPTMDTRVELYSVEHIKAYSGFMSGTHGWEDYATRVGCAYAVLPTKATVVPLLKASSHWAMVQEAGGYVLLRPSP